MSVQHVTGGVVSSLAWALNQKAHNVMHLVQEGYGVDGAGMQAIQWDS